MIKKNKTLKKNKKINKKVKNNFVRFVNKTRTKKKKNYQIRITPLKKNLVKRLNNIRIKLLLKFFKKNIIGIPVKLTNVAITRKKRPIVITKNESGIKENLLLVQHIKAFNNQTEALSQKLEIKFNNKFALKTKAIPQIFETNKVLGKKEFKSEQRFNNLKEISNYLQSQILQDSYEIIRKSIKKKDKKNVFKYQTINVKNLKAYLKLTNNLKKGRMFLVKQKPSKKTFLFLHEKRAINKLKKKFSTIFWKIRTGRVKKKFAKEYLKNQNNHIKEKKKINKNLKNIKKNLQLLNSTKTTKSKQLIEFNLLNTLFNITNDYSKKDEEQLKVTYHAAIMCLTKLQKRNKLGSSKKKSEIKIKKQNYKEGQKQLLRIKNQIKKNLITLVINEQEKKQELSKDIIVKVILNIIKGIGQPLTNNAIFNMYTYLDGIQNGIEKALPNVELIEEQIKSRLINELMKKKNINSVLEYQKELMYKYVEFNQVAKVFPKVWVRPEVFNPFIKEYYKKKNEFDKSKRKYYEFLGTGLNNVYNIISNTITEDNKVYNLRLPKKRLIVPNLKQIYKGLKNIGIPRYKKRKKYKRQQRKLLIKQKRKERKLRKKGIKILKQKKKIKKKKTTKLKVGILRIKLKRRNMFLVFRDRKTNKVEASTTARKEYYNIYRPKETDSNKTKKRDVKEPVVKAKGPIGKYISTDQFRVRVLTQAFLDLRHKLKYNVLDIEIEKKYKKKFIRTIYKKYWYVFKPQGLFRICRFIKNKPHGQMRKKKARRR